MADGADRQSEGASSSRSGPVEARAAEARPGGSARTSDRPSEKDRAPRDRQKDDEKRLKARQAGEKELLGWIRMSLSLVTTGLGFERGLTFLSELETTSRIDPGAVLRTLAILLMVLGLCALTLACWQHLRLVIAYQRGQELPQPRVSLSLVVALGILSLFLIALVTVLANRDAIKSSKGSVGASQPSLLAAASLTQDLLECRSC